MSDQELGEFVDPKTELYKIEGDVKGIGTVVRTAPVTPRMLRVTFTSETFESDAMRELAPFVGRNLPIYTTFRDPNRSTDEAVKDSADRSNPMGEGMVTRPFTIRRYDDSTREMDLDFALHDGGGTACTFAKNAREGVTFGFWVRPAIYYLKPPADAETYVFAGDETGLPGIACILEHLPPTTRALVFLEVKDEAEEQQLQTVADVSVTWLHRGSRPAGTAGLLEQALRELDWPTHPVYVSVSGEEMELRAIRRYLRDERKLDRKHAIAVPYWRYQVDYATAQARAMTQMTVEEVIEKEAHLEDDPEFSAYNFD